MTTHSSSFSMQRHHFAQTVCILNSQGCNIFENIPHALYREVLDLIQHDVLSTDIAHHLHLKKGFEEMAAGEPYSPW